MTTSIAPSLQAATDWHFSGAGLFGMSSVTGSVNFVDTTNYTGAAGTFPDTTTSDFGKTPFTGGLELGFGGTMDNKFHIGLMASAIWGNATNYQKFFQNNELQTTLQLKMSSTNYAAYLKFGYMLASNVLASIGFGVPWRQFSATLQGAPGNTLVTYIGSGGYKAGYMPTVGLEWFCNKCFSLGIQGRFEFYGSKTFNSTIPVPAAAPPAAYAGANSSVTIKPRVMSAFVTLRYMFHV
jgi:hypothetical protein